jgi:hypothetical protein
MILKTYLFSTLFWALDLNIANSHSSWIQYLWVLILVRIYFYTCWQFCAQLQTCSEQWSIWLSPNMHITRKGWTRQCSILASSLILETWDFLFFLALIFMLFCFWFTV